MKLNEMNVVITGANGAVASVLIDYFSSRAAFVVGTVRKLAESISNNKSLERGLKITEKSIVYEKNYWKIKSSHNGYNRKYGIIHQRQIEYADRNAPIRRAKPIETYLCRSWARCWDDRAAPSSGLPGSTTDG